MYVCGVVVCLPYVYLMFTICLPYVCVYMYLVYADVFVCIIHVLALLCRVHVFVAHCSSYLATPYCSLHTTSPLCEMSVFLKHRATSLSPSSTVPVDRHSILSPPSSTKAAKPSSHVPQKVCGITGIFPKCRVLLLVIINVIYIMTGEAGP